MRKRLLDDIEKPEDLRALPQEDLERVAAEMRETILEVTSVNGGHLASNLGVVELTIALHLVFDTSRDKIIWDVGHQAYCHKLLTGRGERFATLRRHGGLSGFPRRDESPHDAFNTGHSSTSISAALGMAVGAGIQGRPHETVAVIGDGSMGAGLAFEGLNQAGSMNRKLIVVLNDNEMSIGPNVGALSRFLTRKLTGPFATRVRGDLERFIRSLPSIGENVLTLAKRLDDSLSAFLSPGMLFECLGFYYIGPIPGHRLADLVRTFENARQLKGPVLIHVITKKGKGYPPAEKDPASFHGVGPFEVETGRSLSAPATKPSYTSVFGETLCRLAHNDERVVAITAAMPEGTGLAEFGKRFPSRFFDVGIAEQHGITFAAGLATEGLVPVAAIYSTFMQRAFDQVLHDVCLQRLPVVLVLDRAGLVGEDGPTHHGLYDLSYLRLMPNLVIMAPKDENELQHMLHTAIALGGPVALRFPRGAAVGVPLEEEFRLLETGRGELVREGGDVALLAVGSMVYPALEAARALAEEGVEAAVVNARFVKPLDEELMVSVCGRAGRVVTVEEGVLPGGFGSAVLELLAARGVDAAVRRMGVEDRVVEHGARAQLREECELTPPAIAAAARAMVKPPLAMRRKVRAEGASR